MRLKFFLFFFLTSLPSIGVSQSDTLQNHPDTLTFIDDYLAYTGNIGALAYQFTFPDSIDSFEIKEFLFCFTSFIDTATLEFIISTGDEPFDEYLGYFTVWIDSSTTRFPNWYLIELSNPISVVKHSKFYIGDWGISALCQKLEYGDNADFMVYDIHQNKWISISGYIAIKVIGNLYYTSIEGSTNRPILFNLYQNYPNPFNPSTTIQFENMVPGKIRIDIFNTSGQILETVYHKQTNVGLHKINFDGKDYSSGIYFYRISSDKFAKTKKMILLK